MASSKLTPCFLKLERALALSHSKNGTTACLCFSVCCSERGCTWTMLGFLRHPNLRPYGPGDAAFATGVSRAHYLTPAPYATLCQSGSSASAHRVRTIAELFAKDRRAIFLSARRYNRRFQW
jgi:hypothetical protein